MENLTVIAQESRYDYYKYLPKAIKMTMSKQEKKKLFFLDICIYEFLRTIKVILSLFF